MAEEITKAQRWLDLIACLLGRRTPMTVEEIFEAVPAYRRDAGPEGDPLPASVRRKFERDKDELRQLGIPIDTVSFTVNYGMETVEGYVLSAESLYLPYLRVVAASGRDAGRPKGRPAAGEPPLDREELDLVLDALREAAEIPNSPFGADTRSAFRKLSFDLGTIPEAAAATRLPPPGAEQLGDVLRQLEDALLRRKHVDFRYHGLARGEATDRRVAPYGLLLRRGAWYLVGHDDLRDAVRMFHVGRMESPRVDRSAPATPDYEIPRDFSVADYGRRDAWELEGGAEHLTARVRFAAPLSRWAERNGHGTLESEEADGAVRNFEVRHVRPFLGWLLGLGGDARILEPERLAEELREMAAGIAAAHRDDGRG